MINWVALLVACLCLSTDNLLGSLKNLNSGYQDYTTLNGFRQHDKDGK